MISCGDLPIISDWASEGRALCRCLSQAACSSGVHKDTVVIIALQEMEATGVCYYRHRCPAALWWPVDSLTGNTGRGIHGRREKHDSRRKRQLQRHEPLRGAKSQDETVETVAPNKVKANEQQKGPVQLRRCLSHQMLRRRTQRQRKR